MGLFEQVPGDGTGGVQVSGFLVGDCGGTFDVHVGMTVSFSLKAEVHQVSMKPTGKWES